ncbi:MAG: hypothetical protein KJ922_06740, partial [Nanoarchaeota archaeon]|nr:hypothetical protein [Nanoarchaeota archaeon]
MDLKKVAEIRALHAKEFPDSEQYYEFLLYQIQSHIVEINDLKENKDPHLKSEIVDLAILSQLLTMQQDTPKDIFQKRYGRFK